MRHVGAAYIESKDFQSHVHDRKNAVKILKDLAMSRAWSTGSEWLSMRLLAKQKDFDCAQNRTGRSFSLPSPRSLLSTRETRSGSRYMAATRSRGVFTRTIYAGLYLTVFGFVGIGRMNADMLKNHFDLKKQEYPLSIETSVLSAAVMELRITSISPT